MTKKPKKSSESSNGNNTEKDKTPGTPVKPAPVEDPIPPTTPVAFSKEVQALFEGMRKENRDNMERIKNRIDNSHKQNLEQLTSIFSSRSRSMSTQRKRENETPKGGGGQKTPRDKLFTPNNSLGTT